MSVISKYFNRIECSKNNIICLTQDHKFYVEGPNVDKHFGDCGDIPALRYHPRIYEEEEKVVDFGVGTNYHIYITDNHKVYCAGTEFLKYLNIDV